MNIQSPRKPQQLGPAGWNQRIRKRESGTAPGRSLAKSSVIDDGNDGDDCPDRPLHESSAGSTEVRVSVSISQSVLFLQTGQTFGWKNRLMNRPGRWRLQKMFQASDLGREKISGRS
jgi:hypothetical protein